MKKKIKAGLPKLRQRLIELLHSDRCIYWISLPSHDHSFKNPDMGVCILSKWAINKYCNYKRPCVKDIEGLFKQFDYIML